MPDFTVVTSEQCAQTEVTVGGGKYTVSNLFSERSQPRCSCPGFTYRGTCKHLAEAQEKACGWHAMWSPEGQEEPGKCPKCGGPTTVVQVAV